MEVSRSSNKGHLIQVIYWDARSGSSVPWSKVSRYKSYLARPTLATVLPGPHRTAPSPLRPLAFGERESCTPLLNPMAWWQAATPRASSGWQPFPRGRWGPLAASRRRWRRGRGRCRDTGSPPPGWPSSRGETCSSLQEDRRLIYCSGGSSKTIYKCTMAKTQDI